MKVVPEEMSKTEKENKENNNLLDKENVTFEWHNTLILHVLC